MANINWQNLPSETTPINSTNLNVMSAGLVNVSNEVDDTYRVNVLKSTNLFDGKIELGNINADTGLNEATTARTRSASFIPVKPNTTYYFYRNTADYSYRWIIGYDINQKGITDGNYQDHPASLMSFVPNTPGGTFTTSSTTYFVRWYDTISTELNDEVSINEGSTRLPYEKFIQRSINVDNEKYSDTLNVGTSVDSRSRVNVLKGENLWNYSNIASNRNVTSTYNGSTLTLNGTTNGEGFNVTSYPSMLYLKAGTYTLSTSIASGTRTGAQSLVLRNTTTSTNLLDTTLSSSGNSYTFTLTNDAYVGLYLYFLTSGQVFTNLKLNIQVEKGSTQTSYEPYITPSIYVDNEMLVSKNVYSTSEVVIGEWFGKPLYRKVVIISSLPNNTATDYDIFTNTSEINECWVDVGMSYVSLSNNTLKYPVNWLWTTSAFMFTGMNGKKLRVKTTENQSANNGYFVINYTKTTD